MLKRLAITALLAGTAFANQAPASAAAPAPAAKESGSTADHSKFKELQQPFKAGPDVTKACLSCHTEAAKQVMKTKHWTWEWKNPENGQLLGKKNVINNFCTATTSNHKFCSACHAGYGWEDEKFDFANQNAVDCLVCHEQTGKYKKWPGLSGHPNYKEIEFPAGSGKKFPPVDLNKVAQSVGKPSRANCGACHFLGGGGDAVKHGDLDTSLKMPQRYLDVHMDAKGLNFSCVTCHTTQGHEVPGSRYTPDGKDTGHAFMRGETKDQAQPASCQSCHDQKPHKVAGLTDFLHKKLNEHTDKLACQTCHIPQFARAQPTKMSWDWSTAGKLDANGKPFTLKDSSGHHDRYDSKKGDFVYESDVVPEYVWINGKVKYTLLGDPVNTQGVTEINHYFGSADDDRSRIWPVKVFRGKQPYDVETKSLLVFHTAVGYGEKDDTNFWQNFKWDQAIKTGSEVARRPFSGKFDFVQTEMTWPITHMVAPKEDALTCTQCHSKSGRLQKVQGLYMPGRDGKPWLDLLGGFAALGTLLGVLFHGGLRIYLANRKAV